MFYLWVVFKFQTYDWIFVSGQFVFVFFNPSRFHVNVKWAWFEDYKSQFLYCFWFFFSYRWNFFEFELVQWMFVDLFMLLQYYFILINSWHFLKMKLFVFLIMGLESWVLSAPFGTFGKFDFIVLFCLFRWIFLILAVYFWRHSWW